MEVDSGGCFKEIVCGGVRGDDSITSGLEGSGNKFRAWNIYLVMRRENKDGIESVIIVIAANMLWPEKRGWNIW